MQPLYILGDLIILTSEDEAFAAKHMPDLGHEVKEFKVYHWPLHNWKKLEKKITSPEFECGGHRWRVATSIPSLRLCSDLHS